MSEPELNVELLDKVMDYIREHPNEHDQTVYGTTVADKETGRPSKCGTAMCVAGHVSVTLAGDTPEWEPEYDYDVNFDIDEGTVSLYCFSQVYTNDVYRDLVGVAPRAQTLLGLTDHEASLLFAARNTLDDLERIVERIKAGVVNPQRPAY